ncbi:MAG: hypothetical protein NC394_10545 [Bacteroides sp.]|nr:hypothetical protein [Bacteroides sp.]
MKIKALKSFCGTVTMGIGEIKDVEDGVAFGLIGAGYAETAEEKADPDKQAELVSDRKKTRNAKKNEAE